MLDIASKIISIVVNTRLQQLMQTQGIPFQLGPTPGICYQDAVFTLLALLKEQREWQKHTHVVFIDIVKAFDSVDHDLIPVVLEKLSAPPKLVHVFRKMYSNLGSP